MSDELDRVSGTFGRRCTYGCETWPDELVYNKCPVCGEDTVRYSNVHPLDADEAARAAFEAFYERRGFKDDGEVPEHVQELLDRPLDEWRGEISKPWLRPTS
jgi:hypothetical protein